MLTAKHSVGLKVNTGRALVCLLASAALGAWSSAWAYKDELSILGALEGVEVAADPQSDRRILVYSKASGERHEVATVVDLVIDLLGKETGAYAAVFNNDEADFTPEYLRQFDLVLFNNTSDVAKAIATPSQRNAILEYVRGGGGWAGVHAALEVDGDEWPEYTSMVGGRIDGAPWSAEGTWALNVEDIEHPVAAGFSQQSITVSDELAQFSNYDRDEQRVLVTVKVDRSNRRGREDLDNPVVWIKDYGDGRIFYSSLGHNEEVYFRTDILQLLLNGIQFALGDLGADTSSLPMPARRVTTRREPVPILSPDDELKTIELHDGYYLELVVSEPIIAEPVDMVFDATGKMYVAEFRTYMQDTEGTGQLDRTSRVSLHEDVDGDGRLDRHSVFVDKLLLPRIILPLDDWIIIGETNTTDLYMYRDTDGDGVADEKRLFFDGEPSGRNIEHQPSGLIWSLDNWLYATINPYRLRYNIHGGETIREETPRNRGQFGLSQDSYGKPWFISAGSEIGPLQFQVPIVYGAIDISGQHEPGYRTVWPIDNIPDAEGGTGRLRPDNTLNHFTATTGSEVFRGDRLPADLVGDLLFAEPVGRLIRRTKIRVDDGITRLSNAYESERSEFIRATDPFFRPVNLETGPDGTLYIADMYRGIVQEKTWMEPDSYLYGIVKEYGLDRAFGLGRIWRLRHRDFELGPKPDLLNAPTAELVGYLQHPNGWWRDNAQKLMILRQDATVVPALKTMAIESESEFGRIHAIWTLEGLEAADPAVIRASLGDPLPGVRRAAIRASESLFKRGDSSLREDILSMGQDPDPEVVIQAMMTARFLNLEGAEEAIDRVLQTATSAGVKEIVGWEQGVRLSDAGLPPETVDFLRKGAVTHDTMCFACHGYNGRGQPLEGSRSGKSAIMAPSFVSSDIVRGDPDPLIAVMLHGLTGNSGEGKTYPGVMVPMKANSDEYIASALSFIRFAFGGRIADLIEPDDVARVRNATAGRNTPMTRADLRELATRSNE